MHDLIESLVLQSVTHYHLPVPAHSCHLIGAAEIDGHQMMTHLKSVRHSVLWSCRKIVGVYANKQ